MPVRGARCGSGAASVNSKSLRSTTVLGREAPRHWGGITEKLRRKVEDRITGPPGGKNCSGKSSRSP